MFAPPPLQLTREQIEKLKIERLAREQAQLTRTESNVSAQSGGKLSKVETPSSSLQKTESRSSKTSRRGLFSRSGKSKVQVSNPVALSPTSPTSLLSPSTGANSPASPTKPEVVVPLPPPPPPPAPAQETPGQRAERRDSGGKSGRKSEEEKVRPALPFAAQPRRAPAPPKRPARPPEQLVLRSLPGSFPGLDGPPYPPPEKSPPPPPVPGKSPRRYSSSIRSPQPRQAETNRSILDDKTLNQALSELKIGDRSKPDDDGRPSHPPRASTAPVGTVKPMPKSKRSTMASDGSREAKRLSGVQGSKIDKSPTKKRASAAASLEATLLEIDYPGMKKAQRRATDGSIRTVRISTSPKEMQIPWKRRRKGETMSMLLDAGFFPIKEVTMHNKKNPNISIHIPVPPPWAGDKDLPNTPGSMMATPVEMYHPGPKRSLPPVPRHSQRGKLQRSPLGQVSSRSARANSSTLSIELSPSRMSTIPEMASVHSENTPPSSGVTTPVATQIHLRGGSVVTVTPPELTAWRQHLYIQGPIKLPKPTIMPRKNSLASLEAFQEAIDDIYQGALTVPRRRSDDAVLEDVVEWFVDFGFDEVKYAGDTLMIEDINVDEVDELAEVDSMGQRFSTPPPGLEEASPLEQLTAMQVVETFSPPPMRRLPALPAVENEETLRARGIARLSQLSAGSRKGSIASRASRGSGRADSIIVTSMLEGSVFTGSSEPPEEEEDTVPMVVDQGGNFMDFDDDVEELNGHTPWVAPAIFGKKRGTSNGMSMRETRNPVLKMRRLVATASAIL